jgi:hypothetical protein
VAALSGSRRALALLVAVLASCGGDGPGDDAAVRRSSQVRAAARDAGLPDEVADLLGDAAGVVGERFRVTYDLGGDAGGTAVLTQDPPRRRVDLRAQVAGDEVTRSLLTDDDGTVVCERAGGKWTCRAGTASDEPAAGAFGSDQIDRIVDDLRASRDAYDFRVATRDVAGVTARCLVTELKPGREATGELGAKGTLCISAEGVPLLVETPAAWLRALRYTTAVDGEVFEPPAEVAP